MTPVRGALLLVAFLVELAAIVAVGYYGFHQSGALGWVLGLGLPVVLGVLWGLFTAPKASHPLRGVADQVFRMAWFGCAAALLVLAGAPFAGLALAVVYLLDSLLLRATAR